MNLRFVPTPLAASIEWPAERDGGFADAIGAACIAAPGVETSLARLHQPGTLAVTTGQQPGLFTGPLYTVYKALSAAALAASLEARWRRAVVPVFWLAADDHDFAEAAEASWLDSDGELHTVRLRERPADAPLTPMYRERLGPDVEPVLAALEAALPPSEFRDSTVSWLRRHYRADTSIAAASGGALAELLAPLGVVCLDASHLAVKRAAAGHLIRALGLTRELVRDLSNRLVDLRERGVDPGVNIGDGASLVMLEGKAGRDRLVVEDGAFVTRRGRERFDLAALQTVAAETPERLSPNVLLRPVIESALLPTVAYVAGPGELRYLALTPPVYERMRVPRQTPVPRWSGLIVEPRVDRVLEKFGARLEELLEPGGRLEARVARDQLPEDARGALAAAREALEREYGILERAAAGIDPTMQKTVQSTRNQALGGLADLEKRLVQALRRRQETELRQITRARTALQPGGKPQERVLTLAPFLARYGPELLASLLAEVRRWYDAALEGRGGPA